MKLRIALLASALMLLPAIVSAHDMAGMDMGPMQMSDDNPDSMDMMMSSQEMERDPVMASHMGYTAMRPKAPGDQERADAMVATLRTALAKYKDYRVAEADGFKPFHPEFKQMKIVHFTKAWNAVKAQFTFDAARPTSLLYKRTVDGGYELVGAMYTAPRRATEDQLNARVPLSIARWHKHINFCFPKRGTDLSTVDWKQFGMGSIATREACDAVGGVFRPQIFGWMVHVYPWETSPQLVWAH